MTPGEFTVPFYQGVAWSQNFYLTDSLTTTFIDLTSVAPFTMTVQGVDTGEPTIEVTDSGSSQASGWLTFSLTAEQTATLPVGNVLVGIKNVNDVPYLIGEVEVIKYPH